MVDELAALHPFGGDGLKVFEHGRWVARRQSLGHRQHPVVAVAITIGLVAVNIWRPGGDLPEELKQTLRAEYSGAAAERVARADKVDILDQLLGIVPSNPFDALANAYDGKMLQVVFFALLLGVALARLSSKSDGVQHVVKVFQLLSDAVIEMVHLIMKIAPYGVFALMAGVVADLGKSPEHLGNLLAALLGYMGTVLFALLMHVGVYVMLLHFLTKVPLRKFFRAMLPAQLLAFSSSSSAATLPVTIDCVKKGIGVDEEATSFVLPLGATINMDGTGLYQGVAAVFIATVYQIDLTIGDQLMIVLTATLASIGTAAVPGVGIVMLTIVLAQINVPAEGIALILGVDRPLDMCRTVLNITGDATVCTVVASSEGLLHEGERHHDAA